MPFQLSPGVQIIEKDLTNIVPAVSASNGAFVGPFEWGPVLDVTTISSENQLVSRFGGPVDSNAAWWFTAANFLSYSNNLQVVRCGATGMVNATSGDDKVLIKNETHFKETYELGATGSIGQWVAKYPGIMGNSLAVSIADAGATGWSPGATGCWAYHTFFDAKPSTSNYASNLGATGALDELHVVVYDEGGVITGAPGTILETFPFLSKAVDAVQSDGSNNYYKEVINTKSKYVWCLNDPLINSIDNWSANIKATPLNDRATLAFDTLGATGLSSSLDGGLSITAEQFVDEGDITTGLDLFKNTELYDISLLITGPAKGSIVSYATTNIAQDRMDCVVFGSPTTDPETLVAAGTQITGTDSGAITEATYTWMNETFNTSSSYAVIDSGWKYQYDRYNDKYRWIPLNGDIAGLCARTDNTNDPWWSPGGLNRGQIKNVVKLSLNPNKTDRDELYKNNINPVVAFPGQGTVLFGDKTALRRPSAFDRINVRRLFIVLEKAIAIAAKYQLFEFNDDFTRARFKSIVEPFLRDVQGRRGIIDFRVKCDETNNTGEVIDRNEFVADIYIKPARSINFITLNFIATRTGISFDEIGA